MQNANYDVLPPSFVIDCTRTNKEIGDQVRFFIQYENPYFLRGDLDGDGKNDYVVLIESKVAKRDGILVCFRNGRTVLVGLERDDPPPFWNLSDWDLWTRDEIAETFNSDGHGERIDPQGESIIMRGEDSIGFIYWKDGAFHWKLLTLNDPN